MGISALQKCWYYRAQPARKWASNIRIFPSWRLHYVQIHLIQVMSSFPFCYFLFWITEESNLKFSSFCLSIETLWGFHFLPPKAEENKFSPAENLSVTGHKPECDCDWLGVYTVHWWKDCHGQNFKTPHSISNLADAQRHIPSDDILIILLSELNTN